MAKRYNLQRNAVRVSNAGAWIVKSRIVGMFSIKIARIYRVYRRLNSCDKLLDVCGKSAAKTLIILDTGEGVLSSFNVTTIAKQFDPTAKEEDEE